MKRISGAIFQSILKYLFEKLKLKIELVAMKHPVECKEQVYLNIMSNLIIIGKEL
jgi:hypothetical protein